MVAEPELASGWLKDRLLAGADCGFGTFIRWSLVDPDVAWLKLQALAEDAQIASAEL